MMKKFAFLLLTLCLSTLGAVKISDYGAGPMLKPGRTFYVSVKGSDKNDGKSPAKAFRTITKGAAQLRAGDTLLIGGGEYFEPEIKINVKDNSVGFSEQCGLPGSPIRIMGVKGEKAVIVGGEKVFNGKKNGSIYIFPCKKAPLNNAIHELPSGIELQRVPNITAVRELPGTFYHDTAKKRLFVHFAAADQTGISLLRNRVSLRIHGSFIHLENLTFMYGGEPVYVRMNRPYDKNKASHITVTECSFYHNTSCGIIFDGASWSLIKNNRAAHNIYRGNFLTLSHAHDNLIIGNWSGPTFNSLRQRQPQELNFGINHYGKQSPRNHVIANFIESLPSFRWKSGSPEAIVKDNIFCGSFRGDSKPVPSTITRNLFKGGVAWHGLGGSDSWDHTFKGTQIKFSGNFRKEAELKVLHPELVKAKALKVKLPEPRFPAVTFKELKAQYISHDGAVITWQTPDCDGWGSITLREKGSKKKRTAASNVQGSVHRVGIAGLKPGTEYIFTASFRSRRTPGTVSSSEGTFKTAASARAPKVHLVGKGHLTLEDAACAVLPGDTVKLLPGKHTGQFIPLRGGLPGKPITITGNRKAVIDAGGFYSPSISIFRKGNFIIDGIKFINGNKTARKNIITLSYAPNVTVRNCYSESDWRAGGFITAGMSPNLLVENNIIVDGDYPLNIANGSTKVINNTIVNAVMVSLLFWSPADVEIRNNIFYRPCIDNKRNPALLFHDVKGKIVSDGNVFWSPIKAHPMGGWIRDGKAKTLINSKTLKEWQKLSGMDKNSIHADPQFVSYKKGDYRLKPGSPAKGKGAVL